jgi:putative peptidoglycan lipid II flippase
LSSVKGEPGEQASELRTRINRGLRQIAFFVIPSAVVFLALGDVVVAALYQTGEFTRPMTVYVWGILAGSAVGLLASTLGRLYSSGFYALQDTRTPLRYSLLRVVLTIGVGLGFALKLPGLLGVEARWGAAGLTLAGGFAACVEYGLLRKAMGRRIGRTGIPRKILVRLWGGAAAAAIAGAVVKLAFELQHPIPVALFSLGMYGIAYVAITAELGVPEARQVLRRFPLFR